MPVFIDCPDCGRHIQHYAHGQCKRCYDHRRRPKRPPPRYVAPALVEDFYFIAADDGRRTPNSVTGYDRDTRRRAAERLGVNLFTLERALERHAKRAA